MSSISGMNGGYGNFFDPNSDNGGQVVDSNDYIDQQAMNREISNNIMEQIGGGKNYGFNLANVVGAMVAGEMGNTIPSLQSQITNTNVRISAVAKLENLMAQLQKTTLIPLEGGLSPYSVQSSDPTGITVSAGDTDKLADLQPFTVETTKLAKSDVWVFPAAKASTDTQVQGSGTLTITTAGGQSTEVIIAKDSSLSSIAEQINTAGGKASVVKQSDGYHLVISSTATGSENTIGFGFTADADSDDLSALFNSPTHSQIAQDAEYTINGVSVTSNSNSISYDGISMTLNREGTTATVSSRADNENVGRAVNGFVANYNELVGLINDLTASTPGKDGHGALYKDSDLQKVIEGLQNTILQTLPNSESLYSLGIDINFDGSLNLNQGKLVSGLASDPTLADRVFSTSLDATDANIQISSYNKTANALTPETQSGTYAVNVTQEASKATHQLTSALSLNGDGKVALTEDTTLAMSVTGENNPGAFDGTSTTTDLNVTIPLGDYTPEELAAAIQSQINDNSAVKNSHGEVAVSVVDGHLEFKSENYGSYTGFNFKSEGSTNSAALGMDASEMDTETGYIGQDTLGTINGQLCLGDGQFMQAQKDSHSEAAAGLIIKLNGGGTGDRGTVTIARGYADELDGLLGDFTRFSDLDPTESGVLAKKHYEYQQDLSKSNLDSLTSKLKEAVARKARITEQYFEQYKGVNAALSKLNSEQDYIKNMFSKGKD